MGSYLAAPAQPASPSPAVLWGRVCTCPRDPGSIPSPATPGVRLLGHILGPAGSRSNAADIEARALRSLAVIAPGWARAPPADWTRALRDLDASGQHREALGLSLALYLHDLGLCSEARAGYSSI